MADMRVLDYQNQRWVELRGTPDGALLASVPAPVTAAETVAAGAASTLGKIGTVVNAATIYVRCPSTNKRQIDWRLQCDQTHDVQLYRAAGIVDSVTLTLAGLANGENLVINGLTFGGHTDTTVRASRQFAIDGDDTADAAELAACINPGAYVTLADASVNDTVTVDGITFTAKATAQVASRQFSQAGTDAQDAASLAACVNDKDTVTLAAASAGDTVTINGLVFTAHATTTTTSAREFSIAGNNDADAAALVTCINDATYGVPGVTAVAAANVISLSRDAEHNTVALTTSNATRLATTAAYGVPGVLATVTDGGEVALTSTWGTSTPTVTTSNGTRLATGTYGVPGVTATSAEAVVTLVPFAASGATVIHAVTGTAAGHCTVASTTLTGLVKDGAAVASVAANNTTAGTLYEQSPNGWPQCYLGVTNQSGSAAATIVVGETAF